MTTAKQKKRLISAGIALIAAVLAIMPAGCFSQRLPKNFKVDDDLTLPERWTLVSQSMSWLATDPYNAQVAFATDLLKKQLVKTEDIGRTWVPIQGLDLPVVTDLVVAPSEPDLIYAIAGSSRIKKTKDGGKTWADLPPLPLRVPGSQPPRIACLAVDPGNHRLILVAATPASPGDSEGGLYRSADGGQSWEIITLPGEPEEWKTGMTSVAFSRVNPIMMMAVGEVGMLRSLDAGLSWERIRPAPKSGWVSIGRADDSWVWIVSGSRITITRNSGKTWSEFELRAPNGAVPDLGQIALDSRSPLVAYAPWHSAKPKEGGIFRTVDGGRSWLLMTPPGQHLSVSQVHLASDGTLLWVVVRSPGGNEDSIWYLIGSIRTH